MANKPSSRNGKKTGKIKAKNPSFPVEIIRSTAGIVVVLIFCLVYLGKYVLTRFYVPIDTPEAVQFEINSPQYLETNTSETISITARNLGQKTIRTQFGVCSDKSCHLTINHTGTDQFFNCMILQNQFLEGEVNIIVPIDFSLLGKSAGLSLWVGLNNQTAEKVADLPIMIAPIPLHRIIFWGIFTILGGLVVWAWSKLWDFRADIIKNMRSA
jgi:hypothetical protein